jgi:Protein of unknown function (DUF3485)
MKRRIIRTVSPFLSLALAGGLFVHASSYASKDNSGPFHDRVRQAVDRIPIRIQDWEGTDSAIPAAASKLLKPNAMFCRRYHQISTGRHATVLMVHCRDSRDMTGHFPPVCYPSHGWTMTSAPEECKVPLWGGQVPMEMYEFSRTEVNHFVQCIIYDFFVLPRGGLATDMSQVVRASADHHTRPYGAAQVQVIFDAGMPESERLETLHDLLTPLGPVVEMMQLKDGGQTP